MAKSFTIAQRAQIAAQYKVCSSVIAVQRWWQQEMGRQAILDPKTIIYRHQKLITTGSVKDVKRSGTHTTAISPENIVE